MHASTVRLMRHGEYINPIHQPLPAGLEKSEPTFGGPIHAYAKGECACQNPMALGWIRVIYQGAIEYTSRTEGLRGMAFMYAVILLPVLVGISLLLLWSSVDLQRYGVWSSLGGVFFAILGAAFLIFAVGIVSFLIRADLFHNEDMPTIFDRRHRKVFRLFREIPSSTFAVFKAWPTRACVYDWDLIEARREREVIASPAAPSVDHRLVFYVRRSVNDPAILTVSTLAARWS